MRMRSCALALLLFTSSAALTSSSVSRAGLLCASVTHPTVVRHRTVVLAARPELTVCQGSVCVKHGTKAIQAAAAQSGFSVKVTNTCLKGCGKGVNVRAKGIGKKMLKGCDDAGKAKAATDALARKLGL